MQQLLLLQPGADLSGIIGPVSQIIQVPPELDLAIEVALGGRLQDVVAKSFADAEAAINYLKGTSRGRATFLPLESWLRQTHIYARLLSKRLIERWWLMTCLRLVVRLRRCMEVFRL